MTGRDGSLSTRSIMTIIIGINASRLILKLLCKDSITIFICVISAVFPPTVNPAIVNARAVILKADKDTGSIPFTWSITSISAIAADRTQLSDKGDSLSPKYAPDRTAPAVIGAGIPSAAPIPIIAIPEVPTVPQDVPVAIDVIAHNISVASRNIEGCITFKP